MKKYISLLTLSLVILFSLLSPSSSFATEANPEDQITQTIDNFYTSLNTQDKNLYLDSITNSDKPEFLFASEHLEPTQISYTISSLEKITDIKYVAYIWVVKNGTSYPLFPYEVQLEEDGHWKVNTNSFSVTTKVNSTEIPLNNIFSENDLFLVQKNESNTNDGIAARGSLSYSFNQSSTDIYLSGSATVYVFPGSYVSGVSVTLYKVSSEYPNFETQYINTSSSGPNYYKFSGYYGYCYFNASPVTSGVTGYYTVAY